MVRYDADSDCIQFYTGTEWKKWKYIGYKMNVGVKFTTGDGNDMWSNSSSYNNTTCSFTCNDGMGIYCIMASGVHQKGNEPTVSIISGNAIILGTSYIREMNSSDTTIKNVIVLCLDNNGFKWGTTFTGYESASNYIWATFCFKLFNSIVDTDTKITTITNYGWWSSGTSKSGSYTNDSGSPVIIAVSGTLTKSNTTVTASITGIDSSYIATRISSYEGFAIAVVPAGETVSWTGAWGYCGGVDVFQIGG